MDYVVKDQVVVGRVDSRLCSAARRLRYVISRPPTSGPRYVTPAQAGFCEVAPVDEYLVHSMEHGYMIIWYNCDKYTAGNSDDLKAKVKEVMGGAGVSAVTGTLKLIGVPRPALSQVLALTAWGRWDKLDMFNRQEILDFIKPFRDGPLAPEPSSP